MSRLSVSVMAHPKRSDHVAKLVADLGISEEQVVWDRRQNRWDTGRRAMMHHDSDAEWHMVIQDDALVCLDLIAGLEQALDHVPRGTIVCPFMGTRRPAKQYMEEITRRAARSPDVSWVRLNTLNWGVAIIVPTRTIEAMCVWADQETYPNYDKRVGRYYWRVLGWPTWYTWPNLVDHRLGPSISGHGESVAYGFIGENESALGLDWGGKMLDYHSPPRGAASSRPKRNRAWTPQRPQKPIAK